MPIGVGEPGVVVGAVPMRARVMPPYPNPFNPQTRFLLDIPGLAGTRVRITLYDVQGRLVRQLTDQVLEPGRHSIGWDGRTASGGAATTGVYFYEVSIGEFAETGKLTLLK